MSSIGTSVAAGVAQTAHNAQRAAREGDARIRERILAQQAAQQSFQMHLSSAGETRDADDELPDKPSPFYEKIWDGQGEPPESPADDPTPDPDQLHLYDPQHPPQPTPLYRHLDIQA